MAVPGAPGRPLAIPPPLSAGDGPDYRNDVSRLRHRHIAGMRVSALIETVIALSALLLLAPLLGIEDRFASVAPHPFWAVVLVVSVYYGVNEGLAAAAFATLALLAFNMPELAFDDSVADWLLRATTQPVLWFMAAMVLGEIRAGHRRERDALLDRLEEMTRQAHTITEAFDRLNTVKRQLEARVAGQVQTVASFCDAAHAIARPDTAAVLAGSDTFVRGTLGCPSHTLFLLKGRLLLGARTQSGPAALDAIPTLSAGDPLFHAIVDDRRYLTVSDQSAADLLAGQAVMAGPIEDIETGRILGMLRIESMAFEALTPTMIHSFRVVCQELGRALVMAEQVEERVAKAGRNRCAIG
jgi:polysaccharide biosynthesis protein PelD